MTNKLKALIRHIENVKDSCHLLGERLVDKGEEDLGRQLIANSYIHDNSKFFGIEWLYLNDETKEKQPALFEAAHLQHITTNLHHPEYWPAGIKSMPRLYVAEMVCDWKSRSSEFGSDLRTWVKDKATKRFGITVQSKEYKEIKGFIDLLLDKGFS